MREGKILAVKGLGGFLLACDAANEVAVSELRRRKRRPHKPFALMVRDLAAARRLCELSPEDEASLESPRRPIVILPRRAGSRLATGIAPGDNTLGIMLPYTPLHYLLFSDSPEMESEWPALVMTSGNLSEEPIVVSNQEALLQLGGVADWFLLHNRDIATRVDDSVVRTFEGRERVLRRSRGFVPQAIDLGLELEEVLAFGGELKNTFCLTKSRYAILSQHIGDLENYETMQFFEETLSKLKHTFKVAPRVAAYDLHPGYMSTRMAMASGIEHKIGVQHHHAHIASCMAENHLRGKVLGVALDGTGFGTDGRIWGGEFLLADFSGFARRAHLRNVLLPGGDAAVRQPWRMALSYLRDAFGQQMPNHLSFFPGIEERQVALVDTMLTRQIQTVETSSCGRLFDAVAALLGLASEVTFEGQAAIALEAAADRGIDERYDFEIEEGEPIILDLRPVIMAIVKDLSRGRRVGEISACFHNTLSVAIGDVCGRIGAGDGGRPGLFEWRELPEPIPFGPDGGRVAASRLWGFSACPSSCKRRWSFPGAGHDCEPANPRRRLTCAWRYPARWLIRSISAVCAWAKSSSAASCGKPAWSTFPRHRLAIMFWCTLALPSAGSMKQRPSARTRH